jgi:hypothetical protein
MRSSQFQHFLVTRYRGPVTGRPLGKDSARSYCSDVGKVEIYLGVNIESADLSEHGIAALIVRLRATGRAAGASVRNSGSALRAYAQFSVLSG